jgi:hypothetical protein
MNANRSTCSTAEYIHRCWARAAKSSATTVYAVANVHRCSASGEVSFGGSARNLLTRGDLPALVSAARKPPDATETSRRRTKTEESACHEVHSR